MKIAAETYRRRAWARATLVGLFSLATLGCASGQGYYFAKPLEPGAALDYWKSRRR
jgi:EAL domain-containing protein (putative c-di-GMP-specific phosphodiesterase class I)